MINDHSFQFQKFHAYGVSVKITFIITSTINNIYEFTYQTDKYNNNDYIKVSLDNNEIIKQE